MLCGWLATKTWSDINRHTARSFHTGIESSISYVMFIWEILFSTFQILKCDQHLHNRNTTGSRQDSLLHRGVVRNSTEFSLEPYSCRVIRARSDRVEWSATLRHRVLRQSMISRHSSRTQESSHMVIVNIVPCATIVPPRSGIDEPSRVKLLDFRCEVEFGMRWKLTPSFIINDPGVD